jgi:DNA-binding CsgD family transcriptional regulator
MVGMQDPVEELERTRELCQRIVFSPCRARLQSGLLEPIACLLGAEMAVFRVFSLDSPKPTLLVGLGMPDTVHDAYLNRYFKLDPIRDLLMRRFGGPLFSDQERPGRWLDGCVTTTYERRRRMSTASMIALYQANFHQYQTKFLSPYNLRHHLGFFFQDTECNRTFVLNFMRGRKSSAFDRLESARARIVGTLLYARAPQFAADTPDGNNSEDAARDDRDALIGDSCGVDVVDRRLSTRELEVAEAVALGLTNKEVGEALSISVRTVENHMRSIFAKLEINTRTRLAAKLHEVTSNTSATRRSIV